MRAHTPGPWTHETRRGRAIILDADRNEVCEAFAAPALIAAAPELLDALRDALACIDEIPETERARLGLYSMHWYGQARAAIARATGDA